MNYNLIIFIKLYYYDYYDFTKVCKKHKLQFLKMNTQLRNQIIKILQCND